MTKISFKKCIVHTFSHGPVPALTGSLVCQHCGSIYHNNCSVLRSDESGSLERHYHPLDTPRFIQVASHQYVEASVILQWKNSMNVAWVSMMNCGRICDTTFSSLNVQLPDGRPYTTNLQSEHLFDAFIIISLLQDCKIRGTTLVVPHEGEQSERFRAAMEAQNRRIRMSGHEREHFCNKCIRVHNDSDGQPHRMIETIVMDGVTLGHPCCGVHACQTPLTSNRDCFCFNHWGLNNVCFVNVCGAGIVAGTRACSGVEHQQLFKRLTEHSNSSYHRKERYRKLGVPFPLPTDSLLNHINARSKRAAGLYKRSQTHNEQLIFYLCGVVVARDMFYGAEVVTGVVEFVEITFQGTNMPNQIIYII
ncbi:hypothetical protein BDV98DRAFT_618550 [Pterulicium gracile]|uniref:CxC6 like cysteine cluster associated with KDZ domain-containing protein n=1 Tax=Pterulicium gracile TaxID=1884261 RepID=A0A5C3Q0R6_9AGAR|nr:hypothetical protein BDV98DRAFT_618550 [Pterula gracilis]